MPQKSPNTAFDLRPSRAHTTRVVATPCALLVAAGVLFAVGWWVAGIVAAVIGVLTASAEVAIGSVAIKYALAPHANVFRAIAPLLDLKPAGKVEPEVDPAAEERERAMDRAVGFGLTRAAALGGVYAAQMGDEARAALRANVLAERGRTYAWLQVAPAWREVCVSADDGAKLVGEVQVNDAAAGRWAVVCHGYGGSWDSMLQYARRFAEAGYNLLMPHMRAHGKSGGRYIGMGWLDRLDVVAWTRWLQGGEAGAPCTDAVLFGHSMGASSVANALGEAGLPHVVRAAVCDCASGSPWVAFASTLERADAPVHPTLDLVRLNLMARRSGYDLAAGDAAAALVRCRVPVLFVHGLADTVVDPERSRALAAAAPRARLVEVPQAGHCQSSLVDPQTYWRAVNALLAEASLPEVHVG